MTRGGMTILPAGYKQVQTRIAGSLNGVMQIAQYLDQDLSNHLGSFNQRNVTDNLGAEKATATEIHAQVSKEASLSQGQISIFYLALDRLFPQSFSRAADPTTQDEEAQEFQKACERDGVPAKALQDMDYVIANRLSGYGSQELKQMVAERIMGIAPQLPVEGQMNAIDDFLVSFTQNPDTVRRYNPRQERETPDDELIPIEHGLFKLGIPPAIGGEQNNVKHMVGHIQFLGELVGSVGEAVQQGQVDPGEMQSVMSVLEVALPHLQQTNARIHANPVQKQLAKQFDDQIKQILGVAEQFRVELLKVQQAAQVQAEEQQNASVLGIMDQAKLASMQARPAAQGHEGAVRHRVEAIQGWRDAAPAIVECPAKRSTRDAKDSPSAFVRERQAPTGTRQCRCLIQSKASDASQSIANGYRNCWRTLYYRRRFRWCVASLKTWTQKMMTPRLSASASFPRRWREPDSSPVSLA